MLRTIRTTVVAAAVAAAGAFATDTADAQWGYVYGPSYYSPSYGGSSFYLGFSTGPRYSYYTPSYSYGHSYSRPAYRYYDVPSYGYGGYYSRPRGDVRYDVYSPFGSSELNYRFRRDGSVRIDVDD